MRETNTENCQKMAHNIHNMRNMGAYKCKKIVFMLINVPAAEQIYHHVCPNSNEKKNQWEKMKKGETKKKWEAALDTYVILYYSSFLFLSSLFLVLLHIQHLLLHFFLLLRTFHILIPKWRNAAHCWSIINSSSY